MTTASSPVRARAVDSPYSWFRLAICMVLGSIGSIGMWSVVIILPTIQSEFGVDRGTASIPYTLTMVGFAIGNLVAGRFVDRLGIMRPLIMAGISLGVGFIWASSVAELWQFALIQGFFIGLGTAVTFGPLIANISHWFQRRRGLAVAATAAGNYAGGAIWPIGLNWLVEEYSWRTTYLFIGIFCLMTMVPLALLLRQNLPRRDPAAGLDDAREPIPKRRIDFTPRQLQILLAIAGVGCCMAMSMPQVHIVAYSADLGFGVKRGAEMLSLMFAGGIFSRLASGFLADYVGGVRTLLLGSVLQCLALLFYLPFDGVTALYMVSFGFGLSQGGIVPSYAIIVREYLPAHEAGERVGLVIMATLVGMSVGGWMSGWIYDITGSYRMAFINGVAWNLLNISIIAFLLLRTRKSGSVHA